MTSNVVFAILRVGVILLLILDIHYMISNKTDELEGELLRKSLKKVAGGCKIVLWLLAFAISFWDVGQMLIEEIVIIMLLIWGIIRCYFWLKNTKYKITHANEGVKEKVGNAKEKASIVKKALKGEEYEEE